MSSGRSGGQIISKDTELGISSDAERGTTILFGTDFRDSANSYDIYGNQNDVEEGNESWFLGGGSNNPLAAGENIEEQQALLQGGSSDALISNPNVDSSKTYGISEAMGAVDTSGMFSDKDWYADYTASDLYYSVTGEDKQGGESETYRVGSAAKGEDGSTSQRKAYELAAQDRWLQGAKAGDNSDYYIDGNNQIKVRKKQVTLTGYDGGSIGASNSGIR